MNTELDAQIDAASDAAIRRMASFAVMTVDWSNQRRSYLDNFLNYTLAVLPTDSPVAFARDAVHPSIVERFNLQLPANIVQQLIRRAIKLGYLDAVGESAIRLTDKGKREVSPIPYTLKKLQQEQVDLAIAFSGWSKANLNVALEAKQAISILLDYVQTYYCSLMSLADGDGSIQSKLPKMEPTPEQKLAAAFVAVIGESDEALFESIANLARGSMMVSALYSPTLVDTTRGFRHTTIYLDTKVVLRALGYEGQPAEQSATELLGMLKRQGARIAIFDFTFDEIQSVLDAVAQKARTGSIWVARPGSVEAFFYKTNASNATIEQHSVRLESKIRGLGIELDPKPPYDNHRYVIAEAEVETALLAGNQSYRPSALKHDVELIASIVRARGGRSRPSLEESRATFMTMNSLVVNTARAVQKQHGESWPLVMFENDIAALTWIKEPLAAPNLPKHQLLATSLGLMNPDKHDWGLYIGEIERLVESDAITDNDVILLRQKYEMDRLAFVSGRPREKDAERRKEIRVSVDSAQAAVKQELMGPIRAERDELAADLVEAHDTVEAGKKESDQFLRALLGPVWRKASRLRWTVLSVLVLACAIAILVTFVPGATAWIGTLPFGTPLVWIIRVVGTVAALIGGLTGPFNKLALHLRRSYLIRRLRQLGVEPDRASDVGFEVG